MNTTTAKTATRIALENATAARQAAEANGTQAEVKATAIAELDAWCADFDARHAAPAPAPAPAPCTEETCTAPEAERTHRGYTKGTRTAAPKRRPVCKACRVQHLRTLCSDLGTLAWLQNGAARATVRRARQELAKLNG